MVDQEPRRFHGDLARFEHAGRNRLPVRCLRQSSGKHWINSQFGEGIITWNTPFLFRTKPAGSRLLVCGPINYFKANAHPLTALIESDWMSMSFTMNWKIMVPDQPVRFEEGEPLFQAIPLVGNVCADLEGASVSYQRLMENPEIYQAYQAWDEGRRGFHDQKSRGEVRPDGWQKDYFQGRDALGRASATAHMTKVKPPRIKYLSRGVSAAGVAARTRLWGSPRKSRSRLGPTVNDPLTRRGLPT